MWIFPKSIISASAQAMEGSTLDFDAQWAIECERLLIRRSKRSRSNCYLREWRAGNLMRLRYGLICDPFLGKSLLDGYLSSVEVIHANRFPQPDCEKEQKTQGTSGLSSEMELPLFGQPCVSLKTLKDISAWGCPTLSRTWSEWVTELRGEYSVRLKSALLTNARECSSWPTAAARDYKGCYTTMIRKDGKARGDLLPDAVRIAEEKSNAWPTPTVQEAGKIGNQANHGQLGLSNHPAIVGACLREKMEKSKSGRAAPVSPSTHGSRQGSWRTPSSSDGEGRTQKQWGNPTARDHKSGRGNEEREYKELTPMVERTQAGKLNPRWVETLMGLPVGWVMPACHHPVRIRQLPNE